MQAYLLIISGRQTLLITIQFLFMLTNSVLSNQNPGRKFIGFFSFLLMFILISTGVMAQETVEINGTDVGSWFERNWMWVVGGVILLLLIILLSSRSKGVRKTTTVVKDTYGNVKSVTTTEEKP